MDPFAMALDAQFNAPGSMAAMFQPLDSAPFPIRAIRSQPDTTTGFGGGELIQASNVFLVRRSEPTADAPRAIEPMEGDMIVIEAGTFALSSEILLDVEGLTWSCGAEPYRG